MITLVGDHYRIRGLYVTTIQLGNTQIFFQHIGGDKLYGYFEPPIGPLACQFQVVIEDDEVDDPITVEELKETYPEWADDLELEILRYCL